LSVDSEEVKEGNRGGKTGLGNERLSFARLEDAASVARVNCENDVLVIQTVNPGRPRILQKASFVDIACIFAPHVLEVDGTDRAIGHEHGIKSLVVVGHDLCSVVRATVHLIWIEEGARD